MDWFKHKTGSHDDPDISDAMDEFGAAGYSVFFITLELYGDEFNHVDKDGWLTLSKRFLARKLRISPTKVQKILDFYSERQRIIIKSCSHSISMKCPKFVDIASNWTKRKTSSPTEGLQRASVVPTAIEVEEEVEEENNSSKEPQAAPPESQHFAKKLPEKTAEEIINLCREIKIEKFNPFQFTQKFKNYHPLAIKAALETIKINGPEIHNIWPYAEKVLKVKSKDFTAADCMAETKRINEEIMEFFRKARASP